MKQNIKRQNVQPFADPIVSAIETCVHCGFCLPTCPTYQELGQEMDSPRGRIVLIKEALEEKVDPAEIDPHIDQCLGCLACETACPSGVKYGELVSTYRVKRSETRERSFGEKMKSWMIRTTLPYPNRFRWAMRFGKLGTSFSGMMPKWMRPMLELVPAKIPAKFPMPEIAKAIGKRRGRVALVAGCAQQVIAPDINQATIEVLTQNGIEVVIPKGQGCCGALSWHTGDIVTAQKLARKNLGQFPSDVDAIITNAAGCGSGIHEYELLFAGCHDQEEAEKFAKKSTDVSAYLAKVGLVANYEFDRPTKVAYHDACHLAHAQSVRQQPRMLLESIVNLELVYLRDSELCCGSAGTYNIDQPEIASRLGQRKAESILDSKCEILAAGNIGCLVQIEKNLNEANHDLSSNLAGSKSPINEKRRQKIEVYHPMEILSKAYKS